jgi:hypothetical protein
MRNFIALERQSEGLPRAGNEKLLLLQCRKDGGDKQKKTWAAVTAQVSSIKKIAYPNSIILFANSMDNTARHPPSPKLLKDFFDVASK